MPEGTEVDIPSFSTLSRATLDLSYEEIHKEF